MIESIVIDCPHEPCIHSYCVKACVVCSPEPSAWSLLSAGEQKAFHTPERERVPILFKRRVARPRAKVKLSRDDEALRRLATPKTGGEMWLQDRDVRSGRSSLADSLDFDSSKADDYRDGFDIGNLEGDRWPTPSPPRSRMPVAVERQELELVRLVSANEINVDEYIARRAALRINAERPLNLEYFLNWFVARTFSGLEGYPRSQRERDAQYARRRKAERRCFILSHVWNGESFVATAKEAERQGIELSEETVLKAEREALAFLAAPPSLASISAKERADVDWLMQKRWLKLADTQATFSLAWTPEESWQWDKDAAARRDGKPVRILPTEARRGYKALEGYDSGFFAEPTDEMKIAMADYFRDASWRRPEFKTIYDSSNGRSTKHLKSAPFTPDPLEGRAMLYMPKDERTSVGSDLSNDREKIRYENQRDS